MLAEKGRLVNLKEEEEPAARVRVFEGSRQDEGEEDEKCDTDNVANVCEDGILNLQLCAMHVIPNHIQLGSGALRVSLYRI